MLPGKPSQQDIVESYENYNKFIEPAVGKEVLCELFQCDQMQFPCSQLKELCHEIQPN